MLDLPQIYTKPSGTELLKTLALLTIKPRTFGSTADEPVKGRVVESTGLTRYLTSIIASPLSWLETDELREAIWDAASARLSERSGRTGMKKLTIRELVIGVLIFVHSNAGNVPRFLGPDIIGRRIHIDSSRTLIDSRQSGHEDMGFIIPPLSAP